MGQAARERRDGSRMVQTSHLLLRLRCPARRSQKPGEAEVLQTWPRFGPEILAAENQPRRSEARGHTAGGAGECSSHQVHTGRFGIPKGFRPPPRAKGTPPAEGGVW